MASRDQFDRQARAAHNQSLFREVNERVEQLNEAFAVAAASSTFVCECADLTCIEQIELTIAEYEALRARPTRFAVFPSPTHVVEDVERVVEQSSHYWVVEKIEEGGRIAVRNNPRAATETATIPGIRSAPGLGPKL